MKCLRLAPLAAFIAVLLTLLASIAAFAGVNASPPVIDDFESGLPGSWFQYGDYGSGVFINPTVVSTNTVPGLDPNSVLQIEFNSAGWGAGTGNNLGGQDWSAYDGLSFWFKGAATGGTFRVILSDNPDPNLPGDTAERFAYEFVDNSAGWRHILIPWGAFFRDYAYQPPGAPNDGLTLTDVQAYALALPSGVNATVYLDDVRVVKFQSVDNFESDLPGSWFQYGDYGSGTYINTTIVSTDTVPGLDPNKVLQIEYNSAGWGAGTGNNLGGQDWSGYNGMGFWFWGSNSGGTYRVILSDNPDPNLPGDTAERFAYEFVDNFSGWRFISVPWGAFFRDYAYQPPGAPNDGLTLTNVQAYALALPGGTRTTYLDQVTLFGDGEVVLKVGFAQSAYTVEEGQAVTLTVVLNAPAATPVSVDVATTGGTATPGVDYQAVNTTLTFPAGVTERTVVLQITDDNDDEGNETVVFTLSNPAGAQLGARSQATVTIVDNDALPPEKLVLLDDFERLDLPSGQDPDGIGVGYVTWNHPAASSAITLTTTPPASIPGAPDPNTVLQLDLTIGAGQWAGFSHAFTNAAANVWLSQDWSSFEGICFWLYGNNTGGTLFFDIIENRNPGSTRDDAERWSVDIPDNFTGWKFFRFPFSQFQRKEIGNGAPIDGLTLTEVRGYAIGGYGSVNMGANTYYVDDVALYGSAEGGETPLQIAFSSVSYSVREGASAVVTVTLSSPYTDTVSVEYRSAESVAMPGRDYVPVSGTLSFAPGETTTTFTVQTFDNSKHNGNRNLMLNLHNPVNAELAIARRAMVTIVDDDPVDVGLIDDFEGWHPFQTTGAVTLTTPFLLATDPNARPGQDRYEGVLQGTFDTRARSGPVSFHRTFAQPQDWSRYNGIGFWYYGSGQGQTVMVELLNNQALTTGQIPPANWVLIWSDEFNDPAGTSPNPNKWTHEIGDGTMYGIPGWGNGERQFYTNDPLNASTDGQGNLVISLRSAGADGRLCWYGPCEYTSARLVSARKNEFQYGRIEARIQVPDGPPGLWPAFWMLGANIGEVGWPQSGEIDIMEYVSRFPNDVFGTIHGPGYSGGASFGNTYTFTQPVASNYHVFSVEWGPDEIHWYVDGIRYHSATPADVAPNAWVFNQPFYLLLNMAIGGNFGGTIDPNMTLPQHLKIDYVRVYGAADTAERFEARFVDNFTGWRQVIIPFAHFTRSANQPAGAPNDGLDLTAMSGYGFRIPGNSAGTFRLDQVHLYQVYYYPLILTP
uniref:Glycosyl hydrolase family protein n=1 Tax=Caldilinea aerophila TaxID=133453 RepID=A0A7C1FGT9_9CHLR